MQAAQLQELMGIRMKQEIENVITFLEENEQYGDDWSNEIKVLKKLLED